MINRLNSFFFACPHPQRQEDRLLALAMRRLEPRFNLYSCTYGLTRDKENTIRSRLYAQGISHSYTLETSLYGWREGSGEPRPFNESDYQAIAHSLLRSLLLIEADSATAQMLLGFNR